MGVPAMYFNNNMVVKLSRYNSATHELDYNSPFTIFDCDTIKEPVATSVIKSNWNCFMLKRGYCEEQRSDYVSHNALIVIMSRNAINRQTVGYSLQIALMHCEFPPSFPVYDVDSDGFTQLWGRRGLLPLLSAGGDYEKPLFAFAYDETTDKIAIFNGATPTSLEFVKENSAYTSDYPCIYNQMSIDGIFRESDRNTVLAITDSYVPNQQGGTSDTGGGDGAFEISSDIIEQFDVSKLISAINTGFMRAYAIKPNEMQLIRDLATYMWTSDFIDNLKKLWGDPMQVIMGLSAIPVTPARGGVQNVVLGNVQSPVAMPPATSQYVVHNCGSITIKKYWGNYLDYKYTKASIYLPFIGGQELDIQKVMGKTLSLAYIIDIVSGACSAQLVADGSVIGNWQGSCAMGLPISAENFSRYYVGALTSAGAGLIKGASAGPIGALAGAITGAAVNSAINPPHVEMNGNVSGAGGYMSCRRPYIQLTLPRQSLAEIYNEIEGYPCNITYTLGELTGYTVVQNVHLENIIATADELEEIEELLKGGVIF